MLSDVIPKEFSSQTGDLGQTATQTHYRDKHARNKSELFEMMNRQNKTESELISSFVPTQVNSRIDEPIQKVSNFAHFKKKESLHSNEGHIDRALASRLRNLKKLSVLERYEPKLAIKQQTIISKTLSALSASRQGSPQNFNRKQDSVQQATTGTTRFVYLLVFDRVIFAGSNFVNWAVFVKPRDV